MAEATYLPAFVNDSSRRLPRHSGLVRLTHWITTGTFVALLVSGVAILLAHPRLYWGETGAVGAPALVDLPLPFVLTGQSGWGRYLHFLSAWVAVLTGLLYVVSGLVTRHFADQLLPARSELSWTSIRRIASSHVRLRRPSDEALLTYNVLQRLTYSTVVFVLFPLMIWTGLAMSPAMTSVFPSLVTLLGGQQSARTLHFFDASLLVLFLVVHVAMVCLAGFAREVRAMMTGGPLVGDERP